MKCPECGKETLRLWGIDQYEPVCPSCYLKAEHPTLRDLDNKKQAEHREANKGLTPS